MRFSAPLIPATLVKRYKRFLADVDQSEPAAVFRQQQRAEVAALAAVPLRSWSYTIDAPVTDLNTVRAAAKQYGAPVSSMLTPRSSLHIPMPRNAHIIIDSTLEPSTIAASTTWPLPERSRSHSA